MRRLIAIIACLLTPAAAFAQGVKGFYRYPALHGQTVVFAAESDRWTVPLDGRLARRLTTHPGEETDPVISPDGRLVAFTARYEGPAEVYTMPLDGGLPTRRTDEPDASVATAWTPDGRLVYTSTQNTRRLQVEEASQSRIGYVHLRAMGSQDLTAWYRQFYPVFNRQGSSSTCVATAAATSTASSSKS